MSLLRWLRASILVAGVVAAATVATVSTAARAATEANPATWLGATEQSLSSAALNLERVRQPERLATGARGVWRLDGAEWAGLVFRETFYLAQGRVQRVALVWQPQASALVPPEQAFQRVVSTLQDTYGAPLMAGGTAFWAVADTDVAVYQQPGVVRVVFKVRELRDASTL